MTTFKVTYYGFSSEQEEAFNKALTTWGNLLEDEVEIKAIAYLAPLEGLHGICIPNLVQGSYFGNPITVTTAQGKAMGIEPFVTDPEADMVVIINEALDLGHFEAVVLHELCHGLGFTGLCNTSDKKGIFSDTSLLGLLSYVSPHIKELVPFWADLEKLHNGLPTLFGCLFRFESLKVTEMPSEIVYTLFTKASSMQICYEEEHSVNVYTMEGAFIPFTSCDHIDEKESIMYPSDAWRTTVDDITRAILRLLKWKVK